MNKVIVNADLGRQRISRHIYGHFAEHLGRCIYEGVWVGEDSPIPNTNGIRDDVVAALQKLQMPNLRWPGGCFADTYQWKDGVGPREKRPSIVNVHWGGVTETNHFGTHEFLELCARLGCAPYICGNLGSGTVREMAEWLEYLTMPGQSPMADLRRSHGREEPWPVTYWAVGNENWGCGGNMRAEYYADEYRRYASYCRNHSGDRLYKVACGQDDAWNEILMREAGRYMDGLSIHYYTMPGSWQYKGSAAIFNDAEWFLTMKKALAIEGLLRSTSAIMDRYDPEKRVGMIVDEWGTWFDVEPGTNPGFLYQQNTMRDALVAALTLNLFNAHAERVHMANIAQTVNVLQAMVLTDGPRMVCTPTYHVFEMYRVHQDAMLLPSAVNCVDYELGRDAIPQISAAASSRDGRIHVTLCNLHHEAKAAVGLDVRGAAVGRAKARQLAGESMDALNTFDMPDAVKPVDLGEQKLNGSGLELELSPHSVTVVELE